MKDARHTQNDAAAPSSPLTTSTSNAPGEAGPPPRFESLLTDGKLGCAVLDVHYQYVYIDDTLAALHGVPVERHLGRKITEILPDLGDKLTALLDRARHESRMICEGEFEAVTPGSGE